MIIQGKEYNETRICAICKKEFKVTDESSGLPINDKESIDFLGVKKGSHVCTSCVYRKLLEELDGAIFLQKQNRFVKAIHIDISSF